MTLDDYEALRPEATRSVQRLVLTGLVHIETQVRNRVRPVGPWRTHIRALSKASEALANIFVSELTAAELERIVANDPLLRGKRRGP